MTMVVSSYMLGLGSSPRDPVRGGWICADDMLLLLPRVCVVLSNAIISIVVRVFLSIEFYAHCIQPRITVVS